MSNRVALEEAMRQLEEIFVLYSRNTITDVGAVAQSGGSVSRARELSNSLTSNADDAVFLNRYVTEVLPQSIASSATASQDNPAEPKGAIIVYHNGQSDSSCRLVVQGETIQGGYVSSVTIGDIMGTIAQKNNNVNKNVKDPRTEEPSLGLIQINSPFLSLPTRNVLPVSLFCNSIPTIEMSRCIPFVNVRVVSPVNGVVNEKANTLSIGSFLMGQDADLKVGSVERDIAESARSVKLPGGILVPSGSIPGNQSVFGMEMFTMPQTLVNADMSVGSRGVPILDRFRPLMSLTSLDVQIVPAGHAAFAYKDATISLKVHDRSRMQDVAQILRPDMFGYNFIELEYGWAHPEDKGANNPYAAFLNAFRQKELYTVVSSNIGMGDDGSVSVTIKCSLKGVRDLLNMTGISDQWVDVTNASAMFEKVNKTIADILADKDDTRAAEDLKFVDIVRSVSKSGASGRFAVSADELDQIKSFLGRLKSSNDADLQALRTDLVNIFGEDGTGGEFKKLNDDATSVFSEKLNSILTSAELQEFGKLPLASNADLSDTSIPNTASGQTRKYVTLGKLLTCMLGSPLTKGNYAEVQLFFYTFNTDAGAVNRRNIAEFPILSATIRSAFAEAIKLDPKMPLKKMMRVILSLVNDGSAPAYGMDQPPKLAEGKTEKQADIDKRNATNTASMQKFGCRSTSFRRPTVTYMMDSIAVDGKPLLRIHFFDKNSTPNDEAIHLLDVSLSSGPKELLALVGALKQGTEGDTSVLQAAAKAEIVNVNTVNGKESYTLNSNSKTLKDYIKRTVPSITYGTPTSVMSGFSVQSIDMQDFETVLLIQATNGTRVPGQQQLNSPQNDMQIYPMNFSASIFGCPLIDYAQEFFIDMSTGTSLDNIYVVNGISHKLTQGSFKTDLELKLTRTTSAASAIDSKIRTLLANIDKKTAGTPAT